MPTGMTIMAEKLYLSYNTIHETVRKLAREIEDSGYDPDLMVPIGTGGFIPARILKTFLSRPILTVGIEAHDAAAGLARQCPGGESPEEVAPRNDVHN